MAAVDKWCYFCWWWWYMTSITSSTCYLTVTNAKKTYSRIEKASSVFGRLSKMCDNPMYVFVVAVFLYKARLRTVLRHHIC